MNDPAGVLADIAIVISGITSIGVLVAGWRKRIQDAARRPYLTGHAAVEEAQTALRLKDNRLAELTESESKLKADLAAAVGQARSQEEQITQLQSRLYQAESQNRELLARAEGSERREREALDRLGALEETVADLKRKLALGGTTF